MLEFFKQNCQLSTTQCKNVYVKLVVVKKKKSCVQRENAFSFPQEGVFPMTQNRALQLLFDLRYLNATLGSKVEEGKSSRSHQDPR